MQNAAECGDVEAVRIFIKRGFQLSVPTSSGGPPLHAAAKSGSRPLVEYIIANGADIFELNYRRTSAIHVAAGRGYLDVVKLLLQHGADLFIIDDVPNRVCDGTTAFEDAMRDKHHEVVNCLSPLLHSGIPNQTLLGMMQAAICAKLPEIAKRLLDLVTGELV
jgi:ankyrin repeat protein